MDERRLGRNGPLVSTLGYGAFKIGRNEKTKYDVAYALPDQAAVSRLLNAMIDLGINYFDTAPAYGLAEERIGVAISHRQHEFTLSTKVGETFENGDSTYDYSRTAIEQRLKTDVLDLVLIHAHSDDLAIQSQTDAISTLQRFKASGAIKQIGLSAKTVAGARKALEWADVLMLEYHLQDQSAEPVIADAAAAGIGVVVKKALASGHLAAAQALQFVLGNPGVCTAVVGTLNVDHMRANLENVQAAGKTSMNPTR